MRMVNYLSEWSITHNAPSYETTDAIHIPFHSCSHQHNPMSEGGNHQEINVERALGVIEEKLQDRSCLPHLVALAKRHPESMNAFISLADSIEHDLSMRRRHDRMTLT